MTRLLQAAWKPGDHALRLVMSDWEGYDHVACRTPKEATERAEAIAEKLREPVQVTLVFTVGGDESA